MCGCIMILKAVVWISKIHSGGLDENVPHMLIYWNACSFYDGTDWEKLEGVMLLEGCVIRGERWGFKHPPFLVSPSLCLWLCLMVWALSYCYSKIFACPLIWLPILMVMDSKPLKLQVSNRPFLQYVTLVSYHSNRKVTKASTMQMMMCMQKIGRTGVEN